ncbi:MAG: NAD-dependent epimerase/dehydratase family protein [Coxiellaceae bacterium]|nr:NAD-dependent epimerase/dehydratase family protein [Coxiellaceae bacterium]
MSRALPINDLDHIVCYAENAFNALRNGRIFITGGTGFFGVWLLESLLYANKKLSLNIEITALSRHVGKFKTQFPNIANDKSVVFVEGDVRYFVFPDKKFSHVIHAATEASLKLNTENPTKMLDVILQGTKHTLDFACHCQAESILLVSSGAVYGRQPPELLHISEDYLGSPDILNSAWAYGIGKRTVEHMALLYAKQHNLNIKIARCFAFVGPYLPLDTHFAIGNFIRDILQNKNIEILGDGTPYRSYQYAADLVIWLLTILCFGEKCVPYNVGSDEAVSIKETAEKVADFSQSSQVIIAKKPDETVLPERYVPSIERAKKALSLKNYIDLTEGIRRTSQWYQEEKKHETI